MKFTNKESINYLGQRKRAKISLETGFRKFITEMNKITKSKLSFFRSNHKSVTNKWGF